MYKFLASIIFFICSLHSIAQTEIKGYIIDNKTLRPVDGATVTLLPKQISTVTNESGMFSFKGKFDSNTRIIVNNIGYASQTFTLADLKINKTF